MADKKKKKNPVLDPVKKRLLDKRNKAPVAKYMQAKKRQELMIQQLLGN